MKLQIILATVVLLTAVSASGADSAANVNASTNGIASSNASTTALAIALAKSGHFNRTTGKVVPPSRPVVVTQVTPGVPDHDRNEMEHGQGKTKQFDTRAFRALDGTYTRQ